MLRMGDQAETPNSQTQLPTGDQTTPRSEVFLQHRQTIYDALRAEAPQLDDAEFGRTLLTQYEDVRATVRHKELSVNAKFARADSYMRRVAATGLDEGEGDTAYEPPLVMLDDPDHRRVRSLMSKAFTPQSVEGMRARIEEFAKRLLDKMDGRDEIDLIESYAGPIPTRAILDMMGLSEASTKDFKIWSEDILNGYDPDRSDTVQNRLRMAFIAMSKEFKTAVEERRLAPKHDLISAMVRAQEEADKLSDLEIISLCTQLMVAGNVTTSDLIGNGIFALLQNPKQLALLHANPGLTENAVEEMLRFDCPISETARIAKHDSELNGCPIKSGDTITASLSAANHDPKKFERPHDFDIQRDTKDHLGFGSGIHVCLGAPLARLEVQIAIAELIKRFPKLRLLPNRQPERRRLPFFSGFTALPVSLR
ncbi:MAG: cytochrome P450 [Pseudomonadota bacterium]